MATCIGVGMHAGPKLGIGMPCVCTHTTQGTSGLLHSRSLLGRSQRMGRCWRRVDNNSLRQHGVLGIGMALAAPVSLAMLHCRRKLSSGRVLWQAAALRVVHEEGLNAIMCLMKVHRQNVQAATHIQEIQHAIHTYSRDTACHPH